MHYYPKVIKDSLADMGRFPLEWWNIRFYIDNPPNDGMQEQVPSKGGEPGIPYERDVFHNSLGRFSLGNNKAVAYFSSDFASASCEALLRERYGQNFGEVLEPYLTGQTNNFLKEEGMGYPITYRLNPDTRIFDLREGSSAYKYFNNIGEIKKLLSYESYDPSITVAKWAYANGVHGITWKSVREPRDIVLCGYNLVMFYEDKMCRAVDPPRCSRPILPEPEK